MKPKSRSCNQLFYTFRSIYKMINAISDLSQMSCDKSNDVHRKLSQQEYRRNIGVLIKRFSVYIGLGSFSDYEKNNLDGSGHVLKVYKQCDGLHSIQLSLRPNDIKLFSGTNFKNSWEAEHIYTARQLAQDIVSGTNKPQIITRALLTPVAFIHPVRHKELDNKKKPSERYNGYVFQAIHDEKLVYENQIHFNDWVNLLYFQHGEEFKAFLHKLISEGYLDELSLTH
jgi:hypothetical protein